ncbi:histidinol dehydrogenase, partial [Promineifilum sp.]|uniref:histidinol dehydrogenase n=1 Tax=Promineifilum sp. TaxID=2664178 RepID=UPI0035B498BB
MITIYSSEEAQRTILRRDMALEPEPPPALRAGLRRIFGEELTPAAAVDRILRDVRARGDAALLDWTRRIDGVALERLAVDPAEIRAAPAALPADLWDSLRLAAGRIRAFHALQPIHSWTTDTLGGRLGQRVTPLRRVGVYVPGGTAPLPSSLLMSAIPAQVAGVAEIVVATPPGRDGRVPPVILAAAAAVGVETIYTLGGAQAVAALAFGTASIPRVDKIVGPGNLFVTLAKRQVFGLVGIDGLNGPTETIVIADETANPAWVAADLLAQAEHDTLATAILLTPSRPLAEAVQAEVARQMEHLSRDGVIAAALAGQGGIVLTADLAEAAALADAFAPEHLCLATAEPAALVDSLRHAGGLFLGERSFEVLGDYVAGPSHTMPTGGTARFASPLNVLDFVRITSLIDLDARTTAELAPVAARLARAEALTAHANAADLRARNPLPNPLPRGEGANLPRSTEEGAPPRAMGEGRGESAPPHPMGEGRGEGVFPRPAGEGWGEGVPPHPMGEGRGKGVFPRPAGEGWGEGVPPRPVGEGWGEGVPPRPVGEGWGEGQVRPDILNMQPYTPILPFDVLSARLGRAPEDIVKLDANENPYGPSPRALAALAGGRYYHIYPDPEANALRDAISRYTGLPKERLLAGMGADELIDLVLRAVLAPGDAVIDCPPSFGMYPFSTAVNAGQYVAVPRRDDFSLDVA